MEGSKEERCQTLFDWASLSQVAGIELGRNSAVAEAEMAKAKQTHTTPNTV